MNKKTYRIEWMGWYGGRGYIVQVKKKWWIFTWWSTIDYFMPFDEAEKLYKKLTSL